MTRSRRRSYARKRTPWVRGLLVSLLFIAGAVSGLVSPPAANVLSAPAMTAILIAGGAIGVLSLFFLLGLQRFSFANIGFQSCLLLEAAYYIAAVVYLFLIPVPAAALVLSIVTAAAMLAVIVSTLVSLAKR